MKNQICKNCTFYSAYYKKWSAIYSKLNHGFCAKHEKLQTQCESCELYRSNGQKEKMRHERLLDSLERSLNSVNDIAQILKENQNDKSIQ